MKSHPLRALLCAVLVTVMLVSLCACNKDDQHPYDMVVHDDITEYCSIRQEGNKTTYACTVTDRWGNVLFHRAELKAPPEVEAISESLLCVYQQFGALAEGSWAVYCNVKTSQTSKVFGRVLAFKGRTVAYTDHLTNAHHVFVRDAVDETVYFKSYTLADADEGEPVLGGKLNEEGDLAVTYLCKGKEKTIVIEMPK